MQQSSARNGLGSQKTRNDCIEKWGRIEKLVEEQENW